MLNILFILLAVLTCAGTLYMAQSIRSLRLRFTVNGAVIGFGFAVIGFFPETGLFYMFNIFSTGLNFFWMMGLLLTAALLGAAIGAVWGIRLDGTRYMFGRVHRVLKEIKWRFIHHHKTSKNAQELLISNTIPVPTKTLILIYNSMFGMPLQLEELQLPPGCAVTTNRRYLPEATAVVFHIPTLRRIPEIQRPPRQLWVAWFMESAGQYPMLNDSKFMAKFDLTMSFRRHGDIWTPYYLPDFNVLVNVPQKSKSRDRLIAMFFSYLGELSGRNTYVQELLRYLDIHSYGRFLRNRPLPRDCGRATKLQVLSEYKFNLAYENTIEKDYVTEKFFDPLEVGCVPVYMGAPNIEDFAPGDHCYINAAEFDGPKALAEYLLTLNEDDEAYTAYHAWRQQPQRSQYRRFFEEQQVHPLLRLCKLVQRRSLELNIDVGHGTILQN